MADSNSYDIKQKLMEMQNMLLKDALKNPQAAPAEAPPPAKQEKQEEGSTPSDDVLSLLKDIQSTQQKILRLVEEINGKIR